MKQSGSTKKVTENLIKTVQLAPDATSGLSVVMALNM